MNNVTSLPFVQRVVLCCLVDCVETDRDTVNATDVRAASKKLLEEADDQFPGAVSEADIIRALNMLVDLGLVDEQRPSNPSPVGKGRPQYSVNSDPSGIQKALEADDKVSSLLS